MVEYVSVASRLSIAEEASYAKAPAAYGFSGGAGGEQQFIGITNGNQSFPDPEWDIREYASKGQGRDGWFQLIDAKASLLGGSFSFLPTSGRMFYYAFGCDTMVGPEEDAHLFKPKNSPLLPSFTTGAQFDSLPNFARVFPGCVTERLELSLTEGQELQATLDYRAAAVIASYGGEDFGIKAYTNADPTSACPPFEDTEAPPDNALPWMFYDIGSTQLNIGGTYNEATGALTGGRTYRRINNFTAGISNNLIEKHYIRGPRTIGGHEFNAQWPFNYLATRPSFDLSIDITPAGFEGDYADNGLTPIDTTSDPDSEDEVYSLLVNPTSNRPVKANIIIPLRREINGATERLDLIFPDCIPRSAPAPFDDEGNESTVSVDFKPRTFHARIVDSEAATPYTEV